MDKKPFYVLLAGCVLVCLLIFFGRLANPVADSATDSSVVDPLPLTTTATTNYWDYLRQQSETTLTTALTDTNGNPVAPPENTQSNSPSTTAPAHTTGGNTESTTTASNSMVIQTGHAQAPVTEATSQANGYTIKIE